MPRWRELFWDKLPAATLVVFVTLPILAVGRGASDFAAPLIILSLRLYRLSDEYQAKEQ